MSASKAIKAIGLPSLRYVADRIKSNPNQLHYWYKNKPERFNAIIHGVKVLDAIQRKTDLINTVNEMIEHSNSSDIRVVFD